MNTLKRIALLVQEACVLEVSAPKPGNVNRNHNFSDTTFDDFIVSAEAIVPAFKNADRNNVGRIVWQAITDSRRRVRANTNLGIVLLLAPLVKACLAVANDRGSAGSNDAGRIRQELYNVLNALTVEDARLVYEAIRVAAPGGMDAVPVQDIAEEPSVTLREAMELAKERDSVASEYVTGFEITYSIALPALKEAISHGIALPDAIVHAFLSLLSRVPDTLIARKNGTDISIQVSQQAGEVLSQGSVYSSRGREKIVELDRTLRDDAHSLNPGTTADLITAAIYLVLYSGL